MVVRTDSPQLQIFLIKTTGVNFQTGTQYRGASGAIDGVDLTPFLGDAGSVRTRKTLNDPCGGFSITFADRISDTGGDTVYALAEPMDLVELRMARIPVGAFAIAPLVMRGYISSVRRVESIAGDGTPQRVVVLEGQDSGKLWQNFSILPEAQMATDLNTMLATYNLNAVTGITFGYQPVADFVTTFTEQIMNAAVGLMSTFSGVTIPPFDPVVSVPADQGHIGPSILQGFNGGRFWDVLEYVADRPWNELFVRDPLDGGNPQLVFRPVPYLDTGGGVIMPGAEEPPIIEWDVSEIVSLDNTRSDYRTANFFWVPPGSSQPDSAIMASVAAISEMAGGGTGPPLFSIEHNNSAMALYGLRKMEHFTRLMPSDLPNPRSSNLNEPGSRIVAGDRTVNWHIIRANQLRLLNLDNVVWEQIRMVVKGHETLQIGNQLRWSRGQFRGSGLISKGYIAGVEHHWVPLRSGTSAGWTTTLTIERSDGFLTRDALGASPYWLEGRRGPFNPTA